MRKHLLIFILVVSCLTLVRGASAATSNEALRGVDHISLAIEEVDVDALAVGLSKEALREMVVSRMKQAGLTVRDGNEKPYLFLWVRVIKSGWFGYAASYRLTLRDWSTSAHDPSTQILVTTWEKGGLVSGTKKKLTAALDDQLKQTVNLFVQDYFDANPK